MAISTFKQGANGYSGTIDTTIRESRPGNDLRSQTGINVDGVDSAGMRNQGLLQFGDIFGTGVGQIPLNATINSAVLKLQVTEGTSEAVSFYRMLTDWSAAPAITWNSLSNGIQTDGVEAASAADVTVASLSTGLRSIDVTSSVIAWTLGQANHGWAILMDGANGWDFSSSETTAAPVLEIDWSPPAQTSPGLTVVETGGSTSVTEGGPPDTLTIALKTKPTATVTVTVSGDDELGLSNVSFTFTPENWSIPQILSVTAIDDAEAEANHVHSLVLTSSSADPAYSSQSATVDVTIIDNDAVVPVPIIVHDTMIRESRATQSYSTAGNVNIDGVDSAGLRNQGLLYFQNLFGDGAGQIPIGAVIRSATLTLDVTDSTSQAVSFHRMLTNWAALPSITWNSLSNGIQTDGVEAVQTADVTLPGIGGGTRNIDVTTSVQAWAGGAVNYGWAILMDGSNGLDFISSEGGVAPRLTVDWYVPQPNIVLTESGGLTYVTEGGNGDTVSVALETAPTANVIVTVAGNSDVTAGPTQLVFTPANWQTAQVVTLAAVNDTIREPVEVRNVTFTSQSSDPRYQGRTATLDVTVYDNDSPSPPSLNPTLVASHETTAYKMGDASGYGIGDPSGIAYVPGLNLLFIADSEHDEAPYFSATNLIAIRPNGTQVASYSLASFSVEPTGLAYNAGNGLLYITDDRVHKMFWVDPANPQVKLGQVDLAPLGIVDAEDPAFDPVTGNVFVLDGSQRKMFELTQTGSLVRVLDLPGALLDAEALAYEPETETFFIGSGATRGEIFQLDRNGNLITSFDILSQDPGILGATPRIKGLELAPSSDPGDGAKLSLYAVDYGLDQQPDGRVFEIDLGMTLPYA